MTLVDPQAALAEQSSFIGYLLGLAGAARMIREMATEATGGDSACETDDFVHLLLGLASIGDAIERLAGPTASPSTPPPPPAPHTRWLR